MLSRLPYRAISWISYTSLRRAFNHFLFSPRHSSLLRHIILTLSLVTCSLLVGLTTDDLGVVLGFNVSRIFPRGAVKGVSCSQCFPLFSSAGNIHARTVYGEIFVQYMGKFSCRLIFTNFTNFCHSLKGIKFAAVCTHVTYAHFANIYSANIHVHVLNVKQFTKFATRKFPGTWRHMA